MAQWFFSRLVVLALASTGAAQIPLPQKAPLNPSFIEYHKTPGAHEAVALSAEGFGLGYHPPPVDLSHAKGQQVVKGGITLSLPISYDLRNVPDKLPPVRNQGSCGDCWAFATYGSLESWLRPAETTWDFSEMDLNCSHGYDLSPCAGGNHFISTAFLSRWEGPAPESCYPHGTTCTNPRPNCALQKRLREALYLPDRGGSLDNANIKEAVMTRGAVYTTMYWSDPYYRSTYASYYYSGSATLNHAVCIVGWDDNYSRTQFNSPYPPANGAFIVRNSWGSSWGAAGYFHISYYDSMIGADNAVFINAEATTGDIQRYEYDPYGWLSNVGYSSNTAWGANIFIAENAGQIQAVTFYTPAVDSAYEVYVYVGCSAGAPRSGTLAYTATGDFVNMGYHTVEVTPPVSIANGQRFSIVLKMTSPEYNYPLCMEGPVEGYCSAPTAAPGQSYLSYGGTSWNDLTAWFPTENICLKALMGPDDPDGDGVYGDDDLCPNSIPGALVDETGCSNGPGDLDRDGDVDEDDLGLFILCSSGPALPRTIDCERADFDADSDVDADDFAYFQRCLSGADVPSDVDCAN